MRFTIITPTLLRPSLVQTCESIDTQPFQDWQHLILVDMRIVDITAEQVALINSLQQAKREFIFCDEAHADFGHTCRSQAWDSALGDYLIYLDDDDVYAPNALALMDEAIRSFPEAPVWGTYPILFEGKFTHKLPAQTGNTMNQIFHLKTYDGYQLRWPDVKIYSGDGLMADMLSALVPHTALDTQPLVLSEGAGGGWPRFTPVRL